MYHFQTEEAMVKAKEKPYVNFKGNNCSFQTFHSTIHQYLPSLTSLLNFAWRKIDCLRYKHGLGVKTQKMFTLRRSQIIKLTITKRTFCNVSPNFDAPYFFDMSHLNRNQTEYNLSVPEINGCHEYVLYESFEMSLHFICLCVSTNFPLGPAWIQTWSRGWP